LRGEVQRVKWRLWGILELLGHWSVLRARTSESRRKKVTLERPAYLNFGKCEKSGNARGSRMPAWTRK
jgi:hypothetical protein